MKKLCIFSLLLLTLLILDVPSLHAQINVDGDFRARWYSDYFGWTRDGRAQENYLRYLGRLRA